MLRSLYNTLSSLLFSFGPAADRVVHLLALPFPPSLLKPTFFGFLASASPRSRHLIESSAYAPPILNPFPVLSSVNLSMSAFPPSVVPLPPTDPPVSHQSFSDSVSQIATDVAIYVAQPSGFLSMENYAYLLKFVLSSICLVRPGLVIVELVVID